MAKTVGRPFHMMIIYLIIIDDTENVGFSIAHVILSIETLNWIRTILTLKYEIY